MAVAVFKPASEQLQPCCKILTFFSHAIGPRDIFFRSTGLVAFIATVVAPAAIFVVDGGLVSVRVCL